MKNEIQVMPLNEIVKMAEAFASSGMFTDAKQMGQAFVKIQAGQEIGIPPFAAMSGIHIIQGKPTLGAGLIASAVKGSGKYDYKIVELNDKICNIDFYQVAEKIGNSTFTIEDAKKAQTKNIDKFPKNMLFARAISNGVKWFCPDVFSGPVYVPEEMPEQTHDVSHIEVNEPLALSPTVIPPTKKVATLSQKRFDELMTQPKETIEMALEKIEAGELNVTQGQHVILSEKYEELLNLSDNGAV